ncbi:hypothetical protein HG536_0B00520 [Torulaspora globosa]|uniref:Autophagy-related protein n=1 Tax=Torulaspora globosa TaxID=48254 RepID=A0A7G3ZCF5_9SACH|nr:uncharacterized protein HG536_0B00520 [Torulaspora globosa]QLL31191.1 hypothetical protein HG536_0B00520 [Torulaspora globosa]
MSYGSLPDVMNTAANSLETMFLIQRARNNVKGWYFYSFSSEPFTVSAVATYIPLLLEQFARINGVSVDDHSVKCSTSHDKCVLGLFNNSVYIDTSSFALYTFSLSVLFQTLLVITVSGLVDVWKTVRFKRKILLFFGFIGSLSLVLLSQLRVDQYYLLPILCVVANSSYGVVNVVGNSLLPVFVSDLIKIDPVETATDPDALTSALSGCGASIGYCSALLVQIISVLLVRKSESHDNVQWAVLFVGLWWVTWQSPMAWLLQDVDPILADETLNHERDANSGFRWHYMKYGWSSLFKALKHASLLRDVVIFLISWFIISDSVTTINSTAILFSKTELKMSTLSLIVISILTMLNAIVGAYLIPRHVSSKFNWSAQSTLKYIICWASVIPLYGMLGFIFNNIGLKHPFEMYIMAVWYGISLGGLSAVSRSVFSLIIPKGNESTFFSLFSITDKGSSIVGPVLVGFLTDRTHNIRYSFYLLFALLMFSLPIINMLDVARGKHEAEELSRIERLIEDDSNDIS